MRMLWLFIVVVSVDSHVVVWRPTGFDIRGQLECGSCRCGLALVM
jgi:hypothetical protein